MLSRKILFTCLACAQLLGRGFAAEQGIDYTLINDRTKLPILTPNLSNRKTQKIKLKNNLEVLLVSDPKTELSGGMMSVKVGSWEDPSDQPGLAHFLEHMLFLGTLKYPKESEYEKFISEHGGQANAFTTDNSTNFVYTVNNQAFPESLARFSSFFKEPLFNPSGVSRELHAIDQEYSKNIEDDQIRQLMVLKELADPHHPFHQFTMGNSQSLSKASRVSLEDWFRSHYSSNLMKLVVLSPLPLQKMVDLVVEDFSEISNKNRHSFIVDYPAFKIDQEKKFVFIEPVKDTRSLTLAWELPTKFSHLKSSQPDLLVSYVLGHEGEKSLLAQLKRENLAESLSSGSLDIGDDLMMFFIDIELTTEGLRELDVVIARCFQTIKNLQTKGIPHYLFDEVQRMATIEYQYQSKENEFAMLMKHADQIQNEDLSTYPEQLTIIQQYNPNDIQELLKYLNPQNALYLVMAPSKLTGVTMDKKEKWVGVEYAYKPIPREMIDKWKQITINPEIDLPAPNIFIPDDLKLVYGNFTPTDRLIPEPILVMNTDRGRGYFAHDDKFGLPRVSWAIEVLTPEIAMDDPMKIVYGDIYVKSLKEDLNKISYQAKMAGLDYDIKRGKNGIRIDINGYSQNAERLLEEILRSITSYTPKPSQFKIIKDSLLREYQNFTLEKPLDQSVELFKSLLYQEYVTESDKATALRKISFKSYEDSIATLFDRTYIEAMLYGNMTEKNAKEILSNVSDTFNKGVYPKQDQLKDGVIVLPQDQGPFYLESNTKALGNAVLLAIENETFSFKDRAAQQILMQGIKEPFFAALRTKQQTGYLVHSFSEEVERKLFNLFVVQSNTHDVRDLLSRFEQFIEEFVQEIGKTELTESQFENIRDALVRQNSNPAKNIAKMGELLSTLAFDYDGDFQWIDKRIDGMRNLSYADFLSISKNFIGRNNKRRLAILLKGEIPEGNAFSYTRARTWNMIRKSSQYEYREGGGI